MTNDRHGKVSEDIKNIYDVLNLVMALKDAYMDIRKAIKNRRTVSRRVKQMRSNLLAVLAADKNARDLGDAFEAGPHDSTRGDQLDLPFK